MYRAQQASLMIKFLCPNEAILDSHCAVILFSASPFVGRKLKIILQYIYIFFMPLAVDGRNYRVKSYYKFCITTSCFKAWLLILELPYYNIN